MLTVLIALTTGLIALALGWLACHRLARRDTEARNRWWEARLQEEREQKQHLHGKFDALSRDSGWALQRLRADKAELERALHHAAQAQPVTPPAVPAPAPAAHDARLEVEAQRLQLALAAMTCRVSESAQTALECQQALQRKSAQLEVLEQESARNNLRQAQSEQRLMQLEGELEQTRGEYTQLRHAYTTLAAHSQQEITALQHQLTRLRDQQTTAAQAQASAVMLPSTIDRTHDARAGELQALINRLEERLEQMETRYSASLSTIWERDTQLMRARGVIERLARSTGRFRIGQDSASKH